MAGRAMYLYLFTAPVGLVPLAFVTRTLTEPTAPAGATAVIFAVEFTMKLVAGFVPNVTAVEPEFPPRSSVGTE